MYMYMHDTASTSQITVINLYPTGFLLAASTTQVPDTEPLVELALCSFPFYRPWYTGSQCLGLPGAQWSWGQHTRSQREVNYRKMQHKLTWGDRKIILILTLFFETLSTSCHLSLSVLNIYKFIIT